MTDVVEVTFPAVGRLVTSLQERQRNQIDLGFVASKDLTRYYALLAMIVPKFTEAQASLLLDALNGVLYDEYSFTFLAKGVADGIRLRHLDQKWGVDAQELLGRLEALTPGECLAVIDAAERFWANPAWDGSMDATLKQLGLLAETGIPPNPANN